MPKIISKIMPKSHFTNAHAPESFTNPEASWSDVAAGMSVEQSVVDSHRQYIANVDKYSSGANFTSVADDNTSGVFTNFLGFSRPYYVEVDPTARQVPSHDTSVFKRNKHMYFGSELDGKA